MARMVIDGYGQVELNNVAFRRDGRIEAQCALDTAAFTSQVPCENGMILRVKKAEHKITFADASAANQLYALNYTTEHYVGRTHHGNSYTDWTGYDEDMYEEEEHNEDFDYEVDKEKVIDVLYDICIGRKEFDNYSEEEIEDHIRNNFNNVLKTYYTDVLNEFEDDAKQKAEYDYYEEQENVYYGNLKEEQQDNVEKAKKFKKVMNKMQEFYSDDLNEEKQELLEMARIGFIPIGDNKGIEVYVNTDDSGNTPHFHVRKRSSHNDFEWDICIKFDSAEYFEHGRHTGTLPSKIAKELDKMLRTVDKKDKNGNTYWEIAISEWNRNNSDVELPDDLEQPDYTMLNK